jgi:hypothetical protein
MPAPSDLLDRLRSAQTAATARRAMRELEDDLTPRELAELLPAIDELTDLPKMASEASSILPELRLNAAQPYRRTDLSDGVAFFSDGSTAARWKSLIVALCGRGNRLMLPWSLFLQYLPASAFDVVILTDRSMDDFAAGIEGYAPDLWSVAQRVLADVDARSYQRLYCYGTSTGGLPALRFGLHATAYRSISVGGLFSWPIYRLESGKSLQAFDPLCLCNARLRGHLVCVHASDSERDTRAALHVQQILKVSRVPVDGTAEHNLVYTIYQAGKLSNFNAQLFDFDPLLLSVSPRRSGGSAGSRGRGAAGVPR